MRIAITGAAGFLGWHIRCALKARGVNDVILIDRAQWVDESVLAAALADADAVLHLAGANRADPDELREGNRELAVRLVTALDATGTAARIVYANSIQSGNGTPFGWGKQQAAELLAAWGERTGSSVVDVLLPNLFGEHGRPHYNSVVSTFCAELAAGGCPSVIEDRELPLLHAQDAADLLLDLTSSSCHGQVAPAGRRLSVSALLDLLRGFAELYAVGDVPDLSDPLHLALFNTYRSFTFPESFPIHPEPKADSRGQLVECLRGHGGEAQVFCSTTRPGITRGEHFHLRKVERFVVLSGTAVIALRRLFHDDVVRFSVSGDRPAIVDMPTMWAHSITNTGDAELMTMFWANEILDPAHPDTYPEQVGALAEVGLD